MSKLSYGFDFRIPASVKADRTRRRNSSVTTYRVAQDGRWLCASCGALHGEPHQEDCVPEPPADRSD